MLVGHNGADDAGVYRLSDDTALVLTVDFFTPVVDDPFDYGRVAAANSLSDVYAMGGRPVVALNIAAFPEGKIDDAVLADIFRGGAATAKEAGIVIAGGHTVSDNEMKYGLSVVGIVHPNEIVANAGARDGDALVLTKALGTGVLTTSLKAGDLDEDYYAPLIRSMTQLNDEAARRMREFGVRACTDISGNALMGHAFELARASNVVLEFFADQVPLLPGTLQGVDKRHLTAGDGTNRTYVEGYVQWAGTANEPLEHVFYDPQTSGGLLVALPADQADGFVKALEAAHPYVARVGRVAEEGRTGIRVV